MGSLDERAAQLADGPGHEGNRCDSAAYDLAIRMVLLSGLESRVGEAKFQISARCHVDTGDCGGDLSSAEPHRSHLK